MCDSQLQMNNNNNTDCVAVNEACPLTRVIGANTHHAGLTASRTLTAQVQPITYLSNK